MDPKNKSVFGRNRKKINDKIIPKKKEKHFKASNNFKRFLKHFIYTVATRHEKGVATTTPFA